MNSEKDSPTPPRRFNRRRKETSVTPAIGDSTNGGLISMSRILKVLIIFLAIDERKMTQIGIICVIGVYLRQSILRHHGLIVTGVPTVTASNNSFISPFSNATQPHVQSVL